MIKNEFHLRKRQARLDELIKEIEILESEKESIGSAMSEMKEEFLLSQIKEIEEEIKQYDAYRLGYANKIMCQNFGDISNMLITARIARGMSQESLAEKAGLHTQQIQKYEANDYMEVKFSTLTQIADALGIFYDFKAKVNLTNEEEDDGFLLPDDFEKQFSISHCTEVKERGTILTLQV
jgi:HTH-type transcriptional regulator/antitoxin HigA